MYDKKQMILFKLRKVGLAMFIVASLLTASPAACTCAPHEEITESENEHHSQQESLHHSHHSNHSHLNVDDAVLASETGTLTGKSCICIVDERASCVSSKSESKELKGKTPLFSREQRTTDVKFVLIAVDSSSPAVASDLGYSGTLKTLLPARAPPRL